MYSVEKVPGKDPLTRTESLVLTRLPPRAEATAYQYNGLVSEVKPTLKEAKDLLALVGTRERIPMRMFSMPVNPSLVSWRLRNVETHQWYEQDKQIMQRASHGPRQPPAKDVTVTANLRPPLKRRDVRAGNG